MAENFRSEYPPRRRRKRVPKWKRMLRRYWPPVRFGLICVALLLAVVFSVKGVAGLITGGGKEKEELNTSPSETTEVTLSAEEKRNIAEEISEKAAVMAQGYDYLGAIELIESFEYYEEFSFLTSVIPEYEAEDNKLVSYPDMDKVTHIFFHSLIVDTDRAFDGDTDQKGYNQYMTTIDEFWKMMESMYEKGFVLVSPYDVAYEVTAAAGYTYFTYGDIRLPEGKKPFLMSQDDLNYYGYMIGDIDGKNETPATPSANGDGFAHKLVVGSDGKVTCEYMDASGNITTGDYDLVPLLEKFISLHPDFSYHGARAMLGVTGYEGVFGYRTKPSYEAALGTEAYQKEIAEAKKVAQALKDQGYLIVSHSYGHPAYGNIEAANVEADSDKWENTVQPIVGETDIILYPHGSDIAGVENYTMDNAKFAALYEDGYRYFFNVDGSVYWCQLGSNYYRGGRRNLDGYRMYYYPKKCTDLFDVDEIFDAARPTPVPKLG